MKFKFKIQQYQTDAVEATVNVFAGQPSKTSAQYRRDLGKTKGRIVFDEEYVGYKNTDVELQGSQLLANIQQQQAIYNIPKSLRLSQPDGLGACSLDVEMETGTGKTYVYIKTMFELNKRYGWSKFIVVVPSIAIREGVAKSFAMLAEHFQEHYGKQAIPFVYNSSNLNAIDDFSSSADIRVMIINTQAFNSSFNEAKNVEGRKGDAAARIIYSRRDDFQSRRPIDVIAANRPIIIMDEPQKMEGVATQKALKNFKPLFVLNYSATHKTSHNCVYALDALDAYRQRLVKKIQVKGITLQNLLGSQSYIYFDSIVLSKNKAPEVKLEIEVKGESSTRRQTCKFSQGDSLFDASHLQAYKDFVITDINPLTNMVYFMNGDSLHKGEVMGDVSEKQLQRIQVRETIKSHFEKEEILFKQGIKTLSLFFIDEVANYKGYDENGEIVKGDLWKFFEDEYMLYLNKHLSLFEDDYQRYLKRFSASEVHNGYFSIDKKGRAINSTIARGEDTSNDISAYDLILKDKERLLSFAEPTRFIFSHSALREGWDNPNVFQICTLRHANSNTAKRQEVGRGLRICVDQQGVRMDKELLGEAVHDINRLTVIANESYSTFAEALQKETREALRERPSVANVAYFEGRKIMIGEEEHIISQMEATAIVNYLYENDYVDDKGNIQQSYHEDLQNRTLAPFSKKLEPMGEQIHKLVQSIFDPSAFDDMIEDANKNAEVVNEHLNKNAAKDEFKRLWEQINHRYVYTVHYDSEELIKKAIASIDKNLTVTKLKYIVTTGEQGDEDVDFTGKHNSRTKELSEVSTSDVAYDLVGDIARGATLTRRTVVRILKGINQAKLYLFKNNPEEFIRNVIRLIKDEKATMIVEHISYNRTEQQYDTSIFTNEKNRQSVDNAYEAKKHILDYVFTDSKGERKFAEDLDDAKEVCVYARLPRTFKIPTPVGHYAPDWAIAFNDNMGVKHIFFVAETKGSLRSMDLKGAEIAKIECAKKLFNEMSTSKVRYHEVTDYQNMLDEINSLA
ncbi:type III restriction enzyme [Prevotella communis]|uniref:Type III restriction enzyme n=1 Tax=Prevotella communis TaxID=2913614 RepID=A0A1H0IWA1_9BACT|nr:DEAD/DEAH box helicase family protein [Prevotella communis]SDO35736.1 type III restriction enzyme [Prevotella communis]